MDFHFIERDVLLLLLFCIFLSFIYSHKFVILFSKTY